MATRWRIHHWRTIVTKEESRGNDERWEKCGVAPPDDAEVDGFAQLCGWWCGCDSEDPEKKGLMARWWTGFNKYDSSNSAELLLAHIAPMNGASLSLVRLTTLPPSLTPVFVVYVQNELRGTWNIDDCHQQLPKNSTLKTTMQKMAKHVKEVVATAKEVRLTCLSLLSYLTCLSEGWICCSWWTSAWEREATLHTMDRSIPRRPGP